MADHYKCWVLRHLIEVCHDEELALRHVVAHVRNPTVKTLLGELASQRAQFAKDLRPHARRLGGAHAADGTTSGALHRVWTAVIVALTSASDDELVADAEHAEALALATYEDVLDDILPPAARDVVARQCAEFRLAHDRLEGFLSH